MILAGRSTTDIKVVKGLGAIPYTNLFAITGVINNLSTTYKLISPSENIDTLPHQQLTTPQIVYVASTSNQDSSTGTGMRVLFVTGLDEFYNMYEELIILDGNNPVPSTNKFAKVFEISAIAYGSNVNPDTGDSNCVGDIYCGVGTFTGGIPSSPICCILASENTANSREAIFTVPDNKLLLVKSIFISTEQDKKENVSAIVQIALRVFGFENYWIKTLPYSFDGIYDRVPEWVLVLPPRTDIQLRIKSNIVKTKSTSAELTCELRDLR